MQTVLDILMLPIKGFAALVRWFVSVSAAARIACIVALFQFVVVLLAVLLVLVAGERAVLQSWWSPGKIVALLLLLVVVPALVYQAARLWLEHQGGRWGDITAAWAAASAELARQQIRFDQAPLFVVLGGDGSAAERSLLADASPALVVEGAPAGGGPLHIYASREAIYLCFSGVGQTAVVAAPQRASTRSHRRAMLWPTQAHRRRHRSLGVASNVRRSIARRRPTVWAWHANSCRRSASRSRRSMASSSSRHWSSNAWPMQMQSFSARPSVRTSQR